MPKHKKWRKSFKSAFVHHIDPEKANELKGTKTEIDGKVEKILNILKEGDGNNRKEPVVVDLIEDFNKHYQSLYASYENLTEELRKKTHGNHEKNSSSSSSSDSSDSDESSNKKGKKNGKVKNNFETDTAVVKQELEMALLEVGDLKRKLAATEDEKEALYLEYQTEGEKSNEEKSKLLAENAEINVELGSLRKVQAELNQRLEEVEKERESLIADKEAAFFNAEELRTINTELQHEKEKLHLELESANGLLSTLKEDYESLKNEVVKLSQMQKTAEEENFKLSSKISHLENEIELAENKNRDLVTESSRVSEELAEKEIELSHHLEIHEAYKEEASARIKDLEQQILHKENEASTQIKDLTDQINAKDKELEDQMSSKITEVNQLRDKISELEKSLVEKRDDFVAIEKEMEEVQNNASIQIAALTEQVQSSENKINEMTNQFQKDIDAKNQEIYQLEDNIDELKTDLEMKVDEVSRLVDNMRNTEVKQRLTSQKLRITEQLLGENEECQLRRVEKLQHDQKLLEEKIAVLSRMNAAYKEAQANVAAEISEKVNGTLTGMDTFGMKFEEDYGHLESRVYEIMNELKFTRNWIIGNNAEKRQLKDEISGLIQQLKNEKENGLKLTVKITELENVVKKGEDEVKSLTQSAEKREEKMRELEREMKEKDNGILRLCEEKREAIRQLCVSIDYHQNRYEDLRALISKRRGGRRHVAAT
ncbi:hypothetical protein ABFS83_01G062700 [Erythranthe nasuta]